MELQAHSFRFGLTGQMMRRISFAQLPCRQQTPLPELAACIEEYRQSLERREEVYQRLRQDYPGQIACGPACNDCCHHLFLVHLLDLFLVRRAFLELEAPLQRRVALRAQTWLEVYPDSALELILLSRYELPRVKELELDLTCERLLCPFLLPGQGCLIYSLRTVICRSHGYPILSPEGFALSSCGKNLCGLSSSQLEAYLLPSRRFSEIEDLKERLFALLGAPQWQGFVVATGLLLPVLLDPSFIDWPALLDSP